MKFKLIIHWVLGFATLLLISLPLMAALSSGSVEKLMLKMRSQSLHKGKVVVMEADLYYNHLAGNLVTRYSNPAGQVILTNSKGELTIYDENANSVNYRQGAEYSTTNNLIYFFLQGKTQDLGLAESGFQLMSTTIEEGVVVTEWFPPASFYRLFNNIKLVHKEFLPVYAAYYDTSRKIAKRVYYSNYQQIGDINFPMLITEFNYIGNDSIINRIRFSELKLNQQAISPWFNFKVPADAQIRR